MHTNPSMYILTNVRARKQRNIRPLRPGDRHSPEQATNTRTNIRSESLVDILKVLEICNLIRVNNE
jgi:hypothetical protein